VRKLKGIYQKFKEIILELSKKADFNYLKSNYAPLDGIGAKGVWDITSSKSLESDNAKISDKSDMLNIKYRGTPYSNYVGDQARGFTINNVYSDGYPQTFGHCMNFERLNDGTVEFGAKMFIGQDALDSTVKGTDKVTDTTEMYGRYNYKTLDRPKVWVSGRRDIYTTYGDWHRLMYYDECPYGFSVLWKNGEDNLQWSPKFHANPKHKHLATWHSPTGGEVVFFDNEETHQCNVMVDGKFICNEGNSEVIHEGNINNYLKGTLVIESWDSANGILKLKSR
jgi:hypothetical protein